MTYDARYTVVFFMYLPLFLLFRLREKEMNFSLGFYITSQSISLGGAYVYCLWLERLFSSSTAPSHLVMLQAAPAPAPPQQIENDTIWIHFHKLQSCFESKGVDH